MAEIFHQARQLLPRLVIAALLVLPASNGFAAKLAKASAKPEPNVQLFDSLEFRGSLRALTKWTDIIEPARAQTEKLANCNDEQASCAAIARSWQQMLAEAKGLSPQEQLNWVNIFFNRWPYRLDMEIYGVSDYWASPEEFMRYSGDCEDYSITKYFALRQLGYSSELLRIVVLKDQIRNIGHAVLAVYRDKEIYIMDNMSNLVLSHSRYLHYSPYYSVNEHYRWAHGQLVSPAPRLPQH